MFFLNLPISLDDWGKNLEDTRWKYCGVEKMFQGSEPSKKDGAEIHRLKDKFKNAVVKGIVTRRLANIYKNSQLKLSEINAIGTGPLSVYFDKQKNKVRNNRSHHQSIEIRLLRRHYQFDIRTYCYFSIPILVFGHFFGAMHIVCHEEDFANMHDKITGETRPWVADLIRNCSYWTESVLIDWEELEPLLENGDNAVILHKISKLIGSVYPEFNPRYDNEIFPELSFQHIYTSEKQKEFFKDWLEKSATIIKGQKDKKRGSIRTVHAIPNPEEFYKIVFDRFYHVLYRFEFLKKPYTIFITALPRDKTTEIVRNAPKKMKYVGIDEMITKMVDEFIDNNSSLSREEKENKKKLLDSKSVKNVIEQIKKTDVHHGVISGEFEKDDLSLSDLLKTKGLLKDYFSAKKTRNQKLEEKIFTIFFEIEDYCYLSIPLIMFGEHDGAVHIVYHKDEQRNFFGDDKNEDKQIKRLRKSAGLLIKIFSYEIEDILFDWEFIGDYLKQKSSSKTIVDEVTSEKFQQRMINEPNKIFSADELDYENYYKKNITYYKKRFEQSSDVNDALYRQSLRNAVLSILIESFAHNVSAHGLTSLNWWFKLRTSYRKEYWKIRDDLAKELIEDYLPLTEQDEIYLQKGKPDFEDFADFLERLNILWNRENSKSESTNYIIDYPRSLTREIQPMFNYLAEKGAFWSGVTRDYHFGGTLQNLYNVLWNKFVDNPLFLGTIARTEGVKKLRLKIIVFHPANQFYYHTGIIQKQIKLEGVFAEIDIEKSRADDQYLDHLGRIKTSNGIQFNFFNPTEYLNIKDDLERRSKFLQPGKDFIDLRNQLQKVNIFFPGGVVGEHAFYTMLESEIRNVKHYTGKLDKIRDQGLTLAISVQEIPIKPNSPLEKPVYQIGIWLDEPNELSRFNQETRTSELMLDQKFFSLSEDIVDLKTKRPKLGGNYQDKVCASFLFNSAFSKVQNGFQSPFRKNGDDSDRDKLFYPWIVSATSPENRISPEILEDFQVWNLSYVKKDERKWFEIYSYPHKNQECGYIKKFFHVWKGAIAKLVTTENSDELGDWDNMARFKFLIIRDSENNKKQLFKRLRKEGSIRILDSNKILDPNEKILDLQNKNPSGALVAAYENWLSDWFQGKDICLAVKETEHTTKGTKFCLFLRHTNGIPRFTLLPKPPELPGIIHKEFEVSHGTETSGYKTVRFRRHGKWPYFTENLDRATSLEEEQSELNLDRLAELMETLLTNVVIFDSRARHRIRNKDKDNGQLAYFREIFGLAIFSEKVEQWKTIGQQLMKTAHFLVVHLDFIEKLVKNKHHNSQSKDRNLLGFFIKEEVLPFIGNRENFILVVTTGRGRTQWWDDLVDNPEYSDFLNFTTFRPIESILTAIENGQATIDDIELKNSLLTVLFGA
ncbi:MAG TPA: hypothetical protein PKE06_02580 [Flavilitoribacter sp.]|nr:hypothetical protein [Flavilitoribacter sp.]HMQ86378.1 hypothetical protein [Flavilitoribacter sp.]